MADPGVRRVLIVEDDGDCRLAVTTALGTRPHLELAGVATTGHEALDLVSSSDPPDVVVLDLGLPDISGLDLIPRLRRAVPACRIVVFSATSDTTTIAEAERTGADRYVTKAGSVVRLLDVLESLDAARTSVVDLSERAEDVGVGRRFVTRCSEEWGYEARVEAIELVASELITNAIIHGRTAATVHVVDTGRSLRLEVRDTAPLPPAPVVEDAMAEHGRGLLIVDALADAWGVRPEGTGKVVWAEFLGDA